MINNFLFNVGATMGERLAYHSSFGVCLLLVYGLFYLFTNVIPGKPVWAVIALLPLLAFYSVKTIARNPAWKNNIALYTTDVVTYPNGAMLNGNACISLFDMSNMPANKSREKGLLDSANQYGLKALSLHPRYFYTHMNLGLVKAKQGDMDSATYHWLKTREMSPYEKKLPEFLENSAAYYYNKGVGFLDKGQMDEALKNLNMAHTIKPKDHRPLYFLGKIYFAQRNFPMAKQMWSQGLSYAPNDSILQEAVKSVANY
jgi:tetratricopeptide (TPR) repeat protein